MIEPDKVVRARGRHGRHQGPNVVWFGYDGGVCLCGLGVVAVWYLWRGCLNQDKMVWVAFGLSFSLFVFISAGRVK